MRWITALTCTAASFSGSVHFLARPSFRADGCLLCAGFHLSGHHSAGVQGAVCHAGSAHDIERRCLQNAAILLPWRWHLPRSESVRLPANGRHVHAGDVRGEFLRVGSVECWSNDR